MTPDELREAIARLGVSQVELAKLLGVNPRTMRRWLAGDSEMSVATEVAIDFILIRRGLRPIGTPEDDGVSISWAGDRQKMVESLKRLGVEGRLRRQQEREAQSASLDKSRSEEPS
jgi:hypothetical protein